MSTNIPERQIEPLGSSGIAAGSVTSPAGVNTNIVISPGALPSGMYEIELTWTITGTPEVLPMNLSWATVTGQAPSNVVLPSLPGSYSLKFICTIATVAQLLFRTIAAGTAGAVYTATLRWTKIA
jgi:hypothetical protein